MTLETFPFDPADHLTDTAAQTELLTDALETGNAAYIANALGIIARARGMTEIAKEAGVTRTALYKSLSPEGDPQLTTLLGVLKAMGIKLSAHAA
jgi:probable addiction module antidote protein